MFLGLYGDASHRSACVVHQRVPIMTLVGVRYVVGVWMAKTSATMLIVQSHAKGSRHARMLALPSKGAASALFRSLALDAESALRIASGIDAVIHAVDGCRHGSRLHPLQNISVRLKHMLRKHARCRVAVLGARRGGVSLCLTRARRIVGLWSVSRVGRGARDV